MPLILAIIAGLLVYHLVTPIINGWFEDRGCATSHTYSGTSRRTPEGPPMKEFDPPPSTSSDAGLEAKKAAEKKRPEQEAHEALDHDSRERVERAIQWHVARAFGNLEERHEREKVSLEERKRITRDELERAMESKPLAVEVVLSGVRVEFHNDGNHCNSGHRERSGYRFVILKDSEVLFVSRKAAVIKRGSRFVSSDKFGCGFDEFDGWMGGQPRWLVDEIQQVVGPLFIGSRYSNGVYPLLKSGVWSSVHVKADIAEEERLEREAVGRAVLESVVGRERERHVENEIRKARTSAEGAESWAKYVHERQKRERIEFAEKERKKFERAPKVRVERAEKSPYVVRFHKDDDDGPNGEARYSFILIRKTDGEVWFTSLKAVITPVGEKWVSATEEYSKGFDEFDKWLNRLHRWVERDINTAVGHIFVGSSYSDGDYVFVPRIKPGIDYEPYDDYY